MIGWLRARREAKAREERQEQADRLDEARRRFEEETARHKAEFAAEQELQRQFDALCDRPFIEHGGKRGRIRDIGIRDRDNALMILVEGDGFAEMFVCLPTAVRLVERAKEVPDVPEAP